MTTARLLLAAGLLALGCASPDAERAASLAEWPPEQRARAEALVARVGPSVVSVETSAGSATGFVVHADGLVLTACHGRLWTGSVRAPDGTLHTAEPLLWNEANDHVLLRVPGLGLPALPLTDVPAHDTPLVVLGRDADGLHAAGGRLLIRHLRYPTPSVGEHGGGYWFDVILHDVPTFPGDSGGPVMDLEGRVIALTLASTRLRLGSSGKRLGFAMAVDRYAPLTDMLAGLDRTTLWRGIVEARRAPAPTDVQRRLLAAYELQRDQVPRDGAEEIAWALRGLVDLGRHLAPDADIDGMAGRVRRYAERRAAEGVGRGDLARITLVRFLDLLGAEADEALESHFGR